LPRGDSPSALFCIGQANAENYINSGFFIGAQAGYTHGKGRFDSVYDDGPIFGPDVYRDSKKARKSAGLIGILGGYRYVFTNGFTLGGDIAANYYGKQELKVNLYHPNAADLFVNRLKRKASFIPRLSVGKVFGGRFHASLGFGLGISRFSHQIDNRSRATGPSVKSSSTRFAFVPSAQIEYACTKRISLIGSASYEMYNRVKKYYGQAIEPLLDGTNYTSSIKPKYVTLTAGFIVKL